MYYLMKFPNGYNKGKQKDHDVSAQPISKIALISFFAFHFLFLCLNLYYFIYFFFIHHWALSMAWWNMQDVLQ